VLKGAQSCSPFQLLTFCYI